MKQNQVSNFFSSEARSGILRRTAETSLYYTGVMSITAAAIKQTDRRTYVKCQKIRGHKQKVANDSWTGGLKGDDRLTVMLACISYFFPFLPMNLQLSSSTLADTIWNRSWFLLNIDSNVLISCLSVFRQAIWLALRYRAILGLVWSRRKF